MREIKKKPLSFLSYLFYLLVYVTLWEVARLLMKIIPKIVSSDSYHMLEFVIAPGVS